MLCNYYEFLHPEPLGGFCAPLVRRANWGTRSSQSFRILTVKLGLSTASARPPSLRPVLEAQKIRARAQRVPQVGSHQFYPKDP